MSAGQGRVTCFAIVMIALMIPFLGMTIEDVTDEIRQERAVLCRIEAALSERPPSTPKPEECK